MRYLGVDWGLKRIGLALSEGQLASPWQTISVGSLKQAVSSVVVLAKREQIDKIILGQPEGVMGKMVSKAAGELRKEGLTVVLADETLSTQSAQELMIKQGYGKKDRQDDNAVSAAIILQRFLEEES